MTNQRRKLVGILSLMAALMLSGCGAGREVGKGSTAEKSAAQTATEYHFLEESSRSQSGGGFGSDGGIRNAASAGETNSTDGAERANGETEPEEGYVLWNDNSLDDYTAVINHTVKKVTAEGEKRVYGIIFVGENGCARHGNHLYSTYPINGSKEDWDGVNGITAAGELFSYKIEVDPDRIGDQISELGPISGKDGYVAGYPVLTGEEDPGFWLYELDGEFKTIRKVKVKFESQVYSFYAFMGDAEGNFHVLYDNKYAVISPEGEIVFSAEAEPLSVFRAFDGGRVALCEIRSENGNSYKGDYRLSEADLKTGSLVEFAASKDRKVREQMLQRALAAAPMDDTRLVWCSEEGVCVYDAGSEETTVVYRWSNHGIIPKGVDDLMVTSDGSIAMLYTDSVEDGTFFLLLQPTKEKKELKSITLAVHPYNKEKYEKTAAYFQKKHPEYVIVIQDDWDETSLLAKLGAGEGPVLVDTQLTGFEKLEKLWQPLDGFLEQAGLVDQIIPAILEYGKIGDTTYGVVKDFCIDTLLVREDGSKDWDYEGFLNALEESNVQSLLSASWFGDDYVDWREEFFRYLQNGLADNYYLNAETGETIFGTPEFDRVLTLSQKAKKCRSKAEGDPLREGEVLCELTRIYDIYHALTSRRQMEADGVRALGFPTKNGARHMLAAGEPLAIRITATEEEKEIAYTFLKLYLSKEVGKLDVNRTFSVRRDVTQEWFEEYRDRIEYYKKNDPTYKGDMMELDWDTDVGFVEELLNGSTVRKSFPTSLLQVFDEEFGEYLKGRINKEALSDHLRSRVGLYLMEQK